LTRVQDLRSKYHDPNYVGPNNEVCATLQYSRAKENLDNLMKRQKTATGEKAKAIKLEIKGTRQRLEGARQYMYSARDDYYSAGFKLLGSKSTQSLELFLPKKSDGYRTLDAFKRFKQSASESATFKGAQGALDKNTQWHTDQTKDPFRNMRNKRGQVGSFTSGISTLYPPTGGGFDYGIDVHNMVFEGVKLHGSGTALDAAMRIEAARRAAG
jgi:hypothetical protein